MNNTILLYEELTINAHPALQTQVYDGWILRFANGYSNRANSINLLYSSTIDLEAKIAECEKRYSAQGLPALYKITDGTDPAIVSALEAHDYETIDSTYLMRMPLQDRAFPPGDCVITNRDDDEWLDAYFSFSRYADSVRQTTAKQIFDNVKNTAIYVRLVKNGVSAACGSAVIERGYVGLLNIVVNAQHRGKGYGEELCGALLSEAIRLGAHTSYLQVMHENHAAVRLYTKLGYAPMYSYRYHRKKGET